ncbi:hypothetical protein [Specibacter sp. NPDC078692]|uniref:hypothetical protein n=1 Tax=Specibacter sp. NPDC078692 TaxID=3155818 RepID=UPI003420C896
MSFDMDISEVSAVANGLGRIAARALPDVDAVLKKGAQNIKEGMAADASASQHFEPLAGSITYDSRYGMGRAQYEIGPDKSLRGGALGNIYYFGTSRGGGSGDLDKQLNLEAPRTLEFLEQLPGQWEDQL